MATRGKRKTHLASRRHISLKILGEFPRVLERVSFELGQQKRPFRISMPTDVKNPLRTMENFNRQLQLGEKESCYAMLHALCDFYSGAAQFEGLSTEAG